MSWQTVRLDDVAELIRGVTFSKSDASDQPAADRVPILRAGNITDQLHTESDLVFVNKKFVSKIQYLQPEDIVVCMSSGSASVLGKSATLKTAWDGSFGAFLATVRPRTDALFPPFLAHYLRTPDFRTWASSSSGIGIKNIRASDFKSHLVPLPPLDEQKRIAGILDQADALRRLRAQALDKLNTLGQTIFHEMFGDPYSNPREFERCKLGEIVKFIGGSQPPKSTFLYEPGVDRVRFVQIRDFRTDEYRTYLPKELANRPFVEDDVLIGRYGPPVFQILRGLAGTYNVALMKAEPLQGVTNDFVFYLLQEPKLHNYVVANSERTAGQSGVNLKLLNEYPAYLPPSDLLRDFSRCLSSHSQTKKAAAAHLENAKQLFASLQHRAFRGEL